MHYVALTPPSPSLSPPTLTLTLTLTRLVHYVAEAEGLAHRTVDKKTVVLRHKGPCRPAVE